MKSSQEINKNYIEERNTTTTVSYLDLSNFFSNDNDVSINSRGKNQSLFPAEGEEKKQTFSPIFIEIIRNSIITWGFLFLRYLIAVIILEN